MGLLGVLPSPIAELMAEHLGLLPAMAITTGVCISQAQAT